MPYTFLMTYTCPICGNAFQSSHYKPPERCPNCRKAHRARQSLKNYHLRRAEGRGCSKKRDVAYDGGRLGAPESVYSPQCTIHIRREIAECKCCKNTRELVNGYCELCRWNGANEQQCMNPKGIK